jgi:hypothetical protein
MKNLKDKMTSLAGALGAIAFIGAAIVGSLVSSGVAIPVFITAGLGACGAASAGILGYFSGKNPDGSTKSDEQVTNQSGLNEKLLSVSNNGDQIK